MLDFVNSESLALTRRSGEVHFFSRSRSKIWKKGETSGHVLKMKEVRLDCDADARSSWWRLLAQECVTKAITIVSSGNCRPMALGR